MACYQFSTPRRKHVLPLTYCRHRKAMASPALLTLPCSLPKAYLVASESFRCISSYMSTLKVLCTKDRAIFKASTHSGGQRSAINCSRSIRIRPL